MPGTLRVKRGLNSSGILEFGLQNLGIDKVVPLDAFLALLIVAGHFPACSASAWAKSVLETTGVGVHGKIARLLHLSCHFPCMQDLASMDASHTRTAAQ